MITATVRRVGYTTRDTRTGTSEPLGLCLRQFVQTSFGVVCRTDVRGLWEVVLLPPKGPALYIGHVERQPGAWVAIDGNGETVATVGGPNGDYLTAEAMLILASPTAEQAYNDYAWPEHMAQAVRNPGAPWWE